MMDRLPDAIMAPVTAHVVDEYMSLGVIES
jgi:hypothetical protein